MATTCGGSSPEGEIPAYGKLKDFQRHFGLSRSGLRLYEEAGIFTPLRDQGNNYRVITMSNGVRMSLALTYARYGIHLKEVGRLVSDYDDGEEVALLREWDDELNREALELVAKRARLEEHIRHLVRLKNNPAACELVTECDLFLLDALQGGVGYTGNQRYAAEWWRAAPFVCPGALATLDAGGDCVEMVHGPLATGGTVDKYDLPASGAIHFCLPQRRYLTGYTVTPAEGRPARGAYAHLFSYAADNGVVLDASRVLHKLLRCRDLDGISMRYDMVYVPVAE